MQALENLVAGFPDAAKDIRLNLRSVLADSTLAPRARACVALACAYSKGDHAVAAAIESAIADPANDTGRDAAREDAKAVAALMAMNNVYYRFRHLVGKEEYARMSAKLRMTRMAQPLTSKLEFELASLAVSAISGCEMCIRSHEQSLLALGASLEQVHDAVRIAAVVNAAVVARSLAVGAPNAA